MSRPLSATARLLYLIGAGGCVAVAHFVLASITIMKLEAIEQSHVSAAWRWLEKIIGFPIFTIAPASIGVPFPLLMIANSILWGVLVVVVWSILARRPKSGSSQGTGLSPG